MMGLCAALASPRAGILLDSFHWYCAGEGVEDITALSPRQIVAVHVNDAPPLPRDEQTVADRALPGATGVIAIAGFMGALAAIGYDGPVTCEPMAKAIEALNTNTDEETLARVSASLDTILNYKEH